MTNEPQSDPGLQTWKLTLAYDGTDFQGWQVQPGLPTIQGELQAALGRITGESPLPQGSGRTDAGVHALAQVASFTLRAPIPPENLQRALNRTLPPSIRISEARTVRSTAFMRGIRLSPKPTSTASSAPPIARPSSPAMFTPALGRFRSRRFRLPHASLKASTTSSASPQPILTSRISESRSKKRIPANTT